MPQLNYLNNDNIYAAQNLGQGFANALAAPGRARLIQMQEARKRQLEDAYLRMDQEKFGLEQQRFEQERRRGEETSGLARQREAREGAASRQSLELNAADEARRAEYVQAARTFADMYARARFNLPTESVSTRLNPWAQNMPLEDFQQMSAERDATRSGAFITTQNPAAVGRMLEPIEAAPGTQMFDPITRRLALSVPYQQRPMTAREQIRSEHEDTPEQRNKRAIATMTMRMMGDPARTPPQSIAPAVQRAAKILGVSGITPDMDEGTSTPVRVSSQEEYNKLPSGTRYVDPQGNVGTKR